MAYMVSTYEESDGSIIFFPSGALCGDIEFKVALKKAVKVPRKKAHNGEPLYVTSKDFAMSKAFIKSNGIETDLVREGAIPSFGIEGHAFALNAVNGPIKLKTYDKFKEQAFANQCESLKAALLLAIRNGIVKQQPWALDIAMNEKSFGTYLRSLMFALAEDEVVSGYIDQDKKALGMKLLRNRNKAIPRAIIPSLKGDSEFTLNVYTIDSNLRLCDCGPIDIDVIPLWVTNAIDSSPYCLRSDNSGYAICSKPVQMKLF